jgi:hypothetical protein
MKKERQLRLFPEPYKAECAASVEAYFERIGPLGPDLMPLNKKEKKDEQKQTTPTRRDARSQEG